MGNASLWLKTHSLITQINITSLSDFSSFISNYKYSVVYFSTPDCNVCKVPKPKLIKFLEDNLPAFKYAYVDTITSRELAAQKNVFTVPTILFLSMGESRFVNPGL